MFRHRRLELSTIVVPTKKVGGSGLDADGTSVARHQPAVEPKGATYKISQYTTNRTARAWMYREQLREILDRKQIHVVSRMLRRGCNGVMRSKVEPMKDVARMILRHFDGIVAWAQTRQTNGFIEAINGLFQAAKRKARGYASFKTMRTVLFLIAGKLDFSAFNPHAS